MALTAEIKETLQGVSTATLTTVQGDHTTLAKRKLQKQFLELAIRKLTELPLEQRDHSTITIAAPRSILPELKARLSKFRREILELCERAPGKDEIYSLNLSLFPLTEPRRTEV